MKLVETPRLVISLDSGRFDDARIEELALKIEPELDKLYAYMSQIAENLTNILAKERDLNGDKFVFRVYEE